LIWFGEYTRIGSYQQNQRTAQHWFWPMWCGLWPKTVCDLKKFLWMSMDGNLKPYFWMGGRWWQIMEWFYSSSRSVDNESLVSCVLFCIWVLFVCLHVSVFVVCSLMQRWKCIGFGDGASSLLHSRWSLWGMCITSLGVGWFYDFRGEQKDGVEGKL
jgi:hypothetical protein